MKIFHYHFRSTSKSFICLLICGLSFSVSVSAQKIKDKRLFAEKFSQIYSQRENGFDSLAIINDTAGSFNSSINLPFADEDFISNNRIYGAIYKLKTKEEALSCYNQIKDALHLLANENNITLGYLPVIANEPNYETFHFISSDFFTNEKSSIQILSSSVGEENLNEDSDEYDNEDIKNSQKTKVDSSYDVIININPRIQNEYATKVGDRINDEAVKYFINEVAFSKDPSLSKYRSNPTKKGKNTSYNCSLGLPGYSTTFIESLSDPENTYYTQTSQDFLVTEEQFMQIVDSLILKVKVALPDNYYYMPSYVMDGVVMEFTNSPFITSNDKIFRKFEVYYHRVVDKPKTFRLSLIITRGKG